MCIQGKGFVKAQKTFYPIISIKTLENRLIHARNREFHPKTKSVEANGRGVIAIDSPPRSPAPGNFNFSRFLSNVVRLEERRGLVSKMIDAMRGELMELPGDFGENPGYDGKAIESRSTGQRSRKTGETSDPEADWGKHEYSGVDSDGRAWTKIKTWFGYGLHIIADTRYELPVCLQSEQGWCVRGWSGLAIPGEIVGAFRLNRAIWLWDCRNTGRHRLGPGNLNPENRYSANATA